MTACEDKNDTPAPSPQGSIKKVQNGEDWQVAL